MFVEHESIRKEAVVAYLIAPNRQPCGWPVARTQDRPAGATLRRPVFIRQTDRRH
jgi:hypothetical protein